MSEQVPIPVLEVLDAEAAACCEPGGDHCEIPEVRADAAVTA